MQAVRLAWRAAASLSALDGPGLDTGVVDTGGVAAAGGGVLGGAVAAHDRSAASAEKASRRATAGMKRIERNLAWIQRG
jgi:hypothetical protein